MTINSLKKDFSFAYAGVGGGWILTVANSEYSRLASAQERDALDAHYAALPKLRKTKCQGLAYIMF
jgi:hypothetical protein